MKSFLSLIFCSLAITVTSWTLNEKPNFIPMIVTRNQRQRVQPLALYPEQGLSIQKFLRLKYAMELKCLKELCSHARYRHICYGGRPFQRKRPTPPLQSVPEQQLLFVKGMRGNQLTRVNEMYFPNSRIIYVRPNNQRVPSFQEEPKISNYSQDELSKITPTETTKTIQEENSPDQPSPKEKQNPGNLTQDIEKQTNTSTMRSINSGISNTLNTTRADSNPSSPQIRQTSTHQYEVREIIEEKPEINKYYNHYKGFHLRGNKLSNIYPFKTETKGKSNLQYFQKPSSTLKNFHEEATFPTVSLKQNHRPRLLVDKSGLPELTQIQEQPVKSVTTDYFQNRKENTTTEPKTYTTNSFKTSALTSQNDNTTELTQTKTETEKYTTMLYTSSGIVMTEKKFNRSGLTKTLENVDDFQSLYSTHPNNLHFTPTVTERTINSFEPSTLVEEVKPLTNDIQTTSSMMWQTLEDSLHDWRFAQNTNVPSTPVNIAETAVFSKVTTNEADFTTPEFTNEPSGFDLFTKIKSEMKKDYEGASKNSRKMHFEQKLWKTTISSEIPDSKETEQRRSDILINENNDYFDYGNTYSSINYLEKLKQNHSLSSFDLLQNWTSDMIIPLIPTVVGDLREGKVPPEDMSTLSEIFGRYWTTVLDLSNRTMLDMLPLMKMKNENDLENLLRSLQPEEKLNDTKTSSEYDYKNLDLNSYDFLENYKDINFPVEENQDAGDYNFDLINVTPEY